MKNTIKFLGIIVLATVIGFSMAACDEGDGDGNGDDSGPYTIGLTIKNENTDEIAEIKVDTGSGSEPLFERTDLSIGTGQTSEKFTFSIPEEGTYFFRYRLPGVGTYSTSEYISSSGNYLLTHKANNNTTIVKQ
ncbi:MAG: hypothetical protein LBH44_10895 [Treponema sp.]|jgi:hypothetical protein|nr:hypothetical protein [Treponema sp.]